MTDIIFCESDAIEIDVSEHIEKMDVLIHYHYLLLLFFYSKQICRKENFILEFIIGNVDIRKFSPFKT